MFPESCLDHILYAFFNPAFIAVMIRVILVALVIDLLDLDLVGMGDQWYGRR